MEFPAFDACSAATSILECCKPSCPQYTKVVQHRFLPWQTGVLKSAQITGSCGASMNRATSPARAASAISGSMKLRRPDSPATAESAGSLLIRTRAESSVETRTTLKMLPTDRPRRNQPSPSLVCLARDANRPKNWRNAPCIDCRVVAASRALITLRRASQPWPLESPRKKPSESPQATPSQPDRTGVGLWPGTQAVK